MADTTEPCVGENQTRVAGSKPPKVFVGITLDGNLQRMSQSELLSMLSKLALDCGAKVHIESFEEDGHGTWNLIPEGLAEGGDEHMRRYLQGIEESEEVVHFGNGCTIRPQAMDSTSYTNGHRTSNAAPIKARRGHVTVQGCPKTEKHKCTGGKIFRNISPNNLGLIPWGNKTITVPTIDARTAGFYVNKHSDNKKTSDQTVQEDAWDSVRRVFKEGSKLTLRPECALDPGFYGTGWDDVEQL